MDNKNKRLINLANIFTIFAFIYLIYAIGDIAYRYIASMNANPHLNINQVFKWNSFFSDVAIPGFRVLVLFGIGAILRKLKV
ncbi:hypothetical protein [Virgibacillus halodenitrificans]|uniref:Uncharacterized protein n=1 Tax=Virgibacillus halodenitrificans TaxID=1482 RepID=A0AAC9J1N6_VIRHA|nr:hypothetical protein [Virgibacillus halodenitrificans]APC48843.1 hypothetical protein BME96_11845 [Virgibacillus halodenitrificans]